MLESYRQRATLTRLHLALQQEALERKKREALEATFETVPGDRRFCIRRQEAVDCVVSALGIRVVNNAVHDDVRRIAEMLGWEPLKNGNRSCYRCVKRRGADVESALAASRGNRQDVRRDGHRIR